MKNLTAVVLVNIYSVLVVLCCVALSWIDEDESRCCARRRSTGASQIPLAMESELVLRSEWWL